MAVQFSCETNKLIWTQCAWWSTVIIIFCSIGETEDGSTTNRESITKKKSKVTDANKEKKDRIQMDMIVILTSLLLQDGPLMCLRMTLIFKYVYLLCRTW